MSGACSSIACPAQQANCNTSATDGCEVSLTSDLAHCGACATACDVPANANATCGGATCGYTCDATHADCDGNAANGCEVAITTDASNCGACGTTCTTVNGTEAEWQFAARGRAIPSEGLVSGRLFPWGNTPPSASCDRALWRGCGGTDGGGTRRVGSYPTGVSGGLNDMAGNVYEWMADTFESYRPSWSSSVNPLSNLSLTADRLVRGGSWGDSDPNGLLSVGRFTAPPTLNNNPYVGFRCARALP